MAFFYLAVLCVAFAFTVLVTKICRRLRQRHYEVPARDIRKGHRWCMTDVFSQPTYCSISENHIIHGAFCDSCGVCVEDANVKEADRILRCKELSTNHRFHRHHWVRGNLPLCSRCDICGQDCGTLPQLSDLRCVWCQRRLHEACLKAASEVCDLGPLRDCIVPPNCVRLKLVGIKGRRHLAVDSVRAPALAGWKPLVVIANRKSGNGDGEQILRSFRALLNPAQVGGPIGCLPSAVPLSLALSLFA